MIQQQENKEGQTGKKLKVSVLVPAYNEASSLPLLLEALNQVTEHIVDAKELKREYEWEFLIINDGSRDNTLDVLESLRQQDSRLHYINLSRNFGKENALMAGFDYATGDCVIIMDADLQHPVSAIPEMLQKWEEGFDDVYGKRLTRGKESFLRKRLSLAYYSLLQKSTRIDILPNVGDFRLLDRSCIDTLRSLRETQRNTKGLLSWIGFKKTGVDFETQNRVAGTSSFNLRSLMRLAIEGITGFTTAPLRFATILGLLVSFIAFIYIIVILCKTIFCGEIVQGYPTLMCVILFLGGCQLLAIGIIGEYIGRIFNESKHRPIYIAENYDGKKL